MSHWNHRVVKKVWNKGTPAEEESFGVHEVFYNADNSINSYMVEPIDLSAESIPALREYLEWCLKALDNPILVDGEVEFTTVIDKEELVAEKMFKSIIQEDYEKVEEIAKDYTIIKNSAKCLICNDVLESKYRHDFVTCSCGNLSVDSGTDYLKRSVKDSSKVEELSE
jgi:hypothetical protein